MMDPNEIIVPKNRRYGTLKDPYHVPLVEADFQKFTWGVPAFDAATDLLPLILQIVNGAFGTFPYESNAYLCKSNTTSIPDTLVTIWDNFTDSWAAMKTGVRAV